jgi:hypothetical protein
MRAPDQPVAPEPLYSPQTRCDSGLRTISQLRVVAAFTQDRLAPTSLPKGSDLAFSMRSVMNDPSFAYGRVYGPIEVVEKSITLLQTRLAKMDPDALTVEYLDNQYSELLQMLVDEGLCVITSYGQPSIPKDVWFRHQLTHIARYRE